MSHEAVGQLPDLSPVRAWRVKLSHACARIDELLAASGPEGAAADGVGDDGVGDDWVTQLRPALEQLSRCWQTHVAAAESEHGLLQQIETDAPRLSPAVMRLRRDHLTLASDLDACLQAVDSSALMAVDLAVDRVREHVRDLLANITRHGLEGGELIHEAYRVDIGGGE